MWSNYRCTGRHADPIGRPSVSSILLPSWLHSSTPGNQHGTFVLGTAPSVPMCNSCHCHHGDKGRLHPLVSSSPLYQWNFIVALHLHIAGVEGRKCMTVFDTVTSELQYCANGVQFGGTMPGWHQRMVLWLLGHSCAPLRKRNGLGISSIPHLTQKPRVSSRHNPVPSQETLGYWLQHNQSKVPPLHVECDTPSVSSNPNCSHSALNVTL
jgi:hypothetical protein